MQESKRSNGSVGQSSARSPSQVDVVSGAAQRLLLLGMSCGSLAEESTKSTPGRETTKSRRKSAAADEEEVNLGAAPSLLSDAGARRSESPPSGTLCA